MTVFKTFLKVLNKNKFIVIMYTVILIIFGGMNMKTNDQNLNFIADKPDILIINKDQEEGITKDLIAYLSKHCNIIDVDDDAASIDDALFYRDVNYIIYIKENFHNDFLNKKNPEIEIKSTGDYQASLAELLLERYLKTANVYLNVTNNETELINNINNTLKDEVKVEVTSKLDSNSLNSATSYYNFTNYSLLAGCVYVISVILSSFNSELIAKRTTISSTNYKKINLELLLSNCLFALTLWLLYVILSFILLGNTMISHQGFMYIINSFFFTICTLTIAFLISTIINNKNAINGIVNVIALGSSFLCGAFVPIEWLPSSVLTIAHILPSYYYIKSNELIKSLEVFNFENLKPIIFNIFIIIIFIIIFIIITNIISRHKRKIG